MNYFEYIELENIIGHKRAITQHLKNSNILYGQKGAKINMISVRGKQFTPHWSQTVSPFQYAQTKAPLMLIHKDDPEPASTNWAQARLDPFSFLSADRTSNVYKQPLSENTQKQMVRAVDYLILQTGMSPEAAAGVVGVFMAESGLKPGKYNDSEKERFGNNGGRGLGQWTNVGTNPAGQRRDQYESFLNGRTPTLETDLDFFLTDLENRPKVKDVLLNPNTTVKDAVDAMHRGYENGTSKAFASKEQMGETYSKAWTNDPAISRDYKYSEAANVRLQHAKQALDAYNKES